MKFRLFLVALVGAMAVSLTNSANAADTTVTLTSSASDTYVYQGFPSDNLHSDGYGAILGAANSAGSGHDVKTVVKFDLTGSATSQFTSGSQIQSAQLKLYAITAAEAGFGFGADPDSSHPISLSLQPLLSSWNAGSITYNTLPTASLSNTSSATQTVVDQWVSMDVTSEIKAWLDGSVANNGLLLTETNPVLSGSNAVVGYYYSSEGAGLYAPSLAPELVITPVPEPSSVAMLLSAFAAAGLIAWRLHRRPVVSALVLERSQGSESSHRFDAGL